MFANMRLFKNIIKDKLLMSKVSKVKIIALAKRYKGFPKFSMWAVLANTSSQHLINILISAFFGVTTLGFYSLVQRLLGMPSALIGSSIGQVFFQQATKEKQETGRAINSFNSTMKKLVIISLPSFGILFFIVEDLFAIMFGEEWRTAGVYAQILIPYYFISFISSPLAISMSVFEKQKQALGINIILIITSLLILYLSSIYRIGFIDFLYFLSYTMTFNYFIFIFYYKIISKGKV